MTFIKDSEPRCYENYIMDSLEFCVLYMSELRYNGVEKYYVVQNDFNGLITYGPTYEEALDRNKKGFIKEIDYLKQSPSFNTYRIIDRLKRAEESGLRNKNSYKDHSRTDLILTSTIDIYEGCPL